MRDQFVSDIGDFGKYGLLRCLTGLTDPETPVPDLTLGVVWYYRCDEAGNDGKFIRYLCPTAENERRYRACDPDLWDELRQLVESGNRFVRCVEQSSILPTGTRYFRDLLSFGGIPAGDQRWQHRSDWLERALRATKGADIVFLDPDNNVSPHEQEKYRQNGPKYAYLDEIKAFWDRGQSVVVYHQLNRNRTAGVQISEMSDRLLELSGVGPIALRFHRGTARVFFVIPQPQHRERIEARIRRMLTSPWGQCFTEVRP